MNMVAINKHIRKLKSQSVKMPYAPYSSRYTLLSIAVLLFVMEALDWN